ncbi:MAG: class I SAM-dependent methyltransferase [Holophagaceae bacterium]|nr:class I SAM-dependent methyltransferase [Holophagaceae bacterium]
MSRSAFIPALRFHSLTRFYDALLARTLKEDAFKRRLIAQASLEPGMRVLDLGCGTATLSLLIIQSHAEVELHGLDADAQALSMARTKATEAVVQIQFHHGYAQNPPLVKGSFDRILSSLLFHHLQRADKVTALSRAFALLKPGGEMHIADWGKPRSTLQRLAFLSVQLLDGFETTRDSVEGTLPRLMGESGFADVVETEFGCTVFGTLSIYRGRRPMVEVCPEEPSSDYR